MSKIATGEKASVLKMFSFQVLSFVGFLLILAFIEYLSGYSTKQDKYDQVQHVYLQAVNLLHTNADKESGAYKSTLEGYTDCIANAANKRAAFASDNKNFTLSSSSAYAQAQLPGDLKACQAKVISEVTGAINPGTDSSSIISQVKAYLAKANSYLYTPAVTNAFLSK